MGAADGQTDILTSMLISSFTVWTLTRRRKTRVYSLKARALRIMSNRLLRASKRARKWPRVQANTRETCFAQSTVSDEHEGLSDHLHATAVSPSSRGGMFAYSHVRTRSGCRQTRLLTSEPQMNHTEPLLTCSDRPVHEEDECGVTRLGSSQQNVRSTLWTGVGGHGQRLLPRSRRTPASHSRSTCQTTTGREGVFGSKTRRDKRTRVQMAETGAS